MRDRSELRRYEKELMVRAQELELEDRHSRLQVELRERLECSKIIIINYFVIQTNLYIYLK